MSAAGAPLGPPIPSYLTVPPIPVTFTVPPLALTVGVGGGPAAAATPATPATATTTKSGMSSWLGIAILIVAIGALVCAIIALYRNASSDQLVQLDAKVVDTSTVVDGIATDMVTRADFGHTRRNAWKARQAAENGVVEARTGRLAATRAAVASEAVQAELPKLAHRSDLYQILAAARAAEKAAKAVPATDISDLATKELVTTETDRSNQFVEDLIRRQKVKVTEIVEE